VTATSDLSRIAPTGEARLTSRVGRTAAAPDIGQPANDLLRAGQAGGVMASRPGLIGGEHLDAFAGGDAV
jgi:hypothetical protein